jgi:hypothetical protein
MSNGIREKGGPAVFDYVEQPVYHARMQILRYGEVIFEGEPVDLGVGDSCRIALTTTGSPGPDARSRRGHERS